MELQQTVNDLKSYLQSNYWLTSNNIFTPTFINYFILFIMILEPRLKSVDIDFDMNSKTIQLVLFSSFFYKWKFHPLLKFLTFFIPSLDITSIQGNLSQIFPGWKIYISLN